MHQSGVTSAQSCRSYPCQAVLRLAAGDLSYLLDRRDEARKTLETVVEQARQAITEGRDAVQGVARVHNCWIRRGPAMRTLGEELAADQSKPCAMRSDTHMQRGSKGKSGTDNASFGCESATTERASTRKYFVEKGPPVTTAWPACTNVPNSLAASSMSGATRFRHGNRTHNSCLHRIRKLVPCATIEFRGTLTTKTHGHRGVVLRVYMALSLMR
jgi:hypothetical protein